MDDVDFGYMRAALQEAEKSRDIDEIPVGAVIVKDGCIIARGHNLRESSQKAASHAEMEAISEANRKLGLWRLDGCDLYVTLEPCPMCAGAMIQSRIRTLYYGAKDPKAGACGSVIDIFGDAVWNHSVNVISGIMDNECSDILSDFFRKLRVKK